MKSDGALFCCWEVTFAGITARVFARSRGRARYIAARDIKEVGWASSIGEAFVGMKCRRASEHDIQATVIGREAIR